MASEIIKVIDGLLAVENGEEGGQSEDEASKGAEGLQSEPDLFSSYKEALVKAYE